MTGALTDLLDWTRKPHGVIGLLAIVVVCATWFAVSWLKYRPAAPSKPNKRRRSASRSTRQKR